ncbi:putative secreted protein (Por secretion system target) [Neolewinella xylanilytica]|uniref:Putative secreted protein (Por secretion system target) n=2 Tax=Neolewinella xylanilytica TaxID=1514080 RepID=A0A2S6I9F4_9BACT|nr:putative secreted protein (Por secretion system target) [Neolewinella xylanilytica]
MPLFVWMGVLLLSSTVFAYPGFTGEDFSCSSDNQPPVPDGAAAGGWRQLERLTAPDGVASASLGSSADIDGNYAVVGAPQDINGGKVTGAAYVYHRAPTGWQLVGKVVPGDAKDGDRFGTSVIIRGQYVVVGAPDHDAGGKNAGAVYGFALSGKNLFQVAKVVAADRAAGDQFGESLAATYDRLFVGASGVDGAYSNTGACYAYRLVGTNFYLEQKLESSDAVTGQQFGSSVDVSGGTLIVGAYRDNTLASAAGAAYIWKYSGSDWVETAKLYGGSLGGTDQFGFAVSIDGGRALVCANRDDDGGTNAGAVYAFEEQAGSWNQSQKIVGGGSYGGSFGSTLKLRGDSAVIGAAKGTQGLNQSGQAHLFVFNGSSWAAESDFPIDDGTVEAKGYFGSCIAFDGKSVIIGANGQTGAASKAGALYAFEPRYTLAATRLVACDGPVILPTPGATDNCTGAITVRSTDAITFSAAGTFSVEWHFADAAGNYSSATQTVDVVVPGLTLPFTEDVEVSTASRACWTVVNGGSASGWSTHEDSALSFSGSGAFLLGPAVSADHDDQLLSPAFPLTTGTEYLMSFYHRQLPGSQDEKLRIYLVDAADDSEVKQLFADVALTANYEQVNLIWTVPTEGDYRIVLEATGPVGGAGVLIDDIGVEEFDPGKNWKGLVGKSSDECTTVVARGLHGFARHRVLDPAGNLVVEIDPNGNELGDVNVSVTDYADVRRAPFTRREVLGRYMDISPQNGSGPYANNGGVKVRIYYRPQELSQFNAARSESNGWSDLVITHYSDINQDCDLDNSTGTDYSLEIPSATGGVNANAQYLEFTTTTFSEFGATSLTAMPATLVDFTAVSNGGGVSLQWWVDGEESVSHYLIERSTDGRTYAAFIGVPAQRAGVYEARDAAPDVLTYYRLRMVDADGTVNFSNVVSIRGRQLLSRSTVFPVPTEDVAYVRYRQDAAGAVRFRVTDLQGRVLTDRLLEKAAGEYREEIDLSGFPAGTYVLVLSGVVPTENFKLVKR